MKENKLTPKQKQELKDRRKKLIFKYLHGLCYFLSVLFIIVCIVVGVNSCSKGGSTNKQQDKTQLHYDNKKEAISDYNSLITYSDGTYVVKNDLNLTASKIREYRTNLAALGNPQDGNNFYVYFSLYGTGYYSFEIDLYSSVPGHYEYFLNFHRAGTLMRQLIVVSNNTSWGSNGENIISFSYDTYLNNNFSITTDYLEQNWDNNQFNTSDEEFIKCMLFWCDYQSNSSGGDNPSDVVSGAVSLNSFTLNQDIFVNACLNQPQRYLTAWPYTGEVLHHFDYECYFSSNHQDFNKIRITYNEGTNTPYMDSSGQLSFSNGNVTIFNSITYINTTTNTSVIVNINEWYTIYQEDNSTTYTAYNWRGRWLADEYRIIEFKDNLVSMDTLNILQKLNSGSLAGPSGTDINITNAFTLLGNAFSSVSSLFTIVILPGITLGTLLFLPLVIVLVLFIIKILRK